MDRISNLPPGIIGNILCFLPIQEAVRTSILSREWRYHWIKIPNLTIIEDTFHVSTDAIIEDTFHVSTDVAELSILEQTFDTHREMIFKRCKLFYAINQILSKHEGPIHEFVLSIEVDDYCDEVDHILSHLAQRNTVKKLRLHFHWMGYMLPLSLLLFRQLTDLSLVGCVFNPPSTFNGFNCLSSLSLQDIYVGDEPLQHLLSNCPLLKNVTLGIDRYHVQKSGNEDSSITNLFKCLPVVETLSISLGIIRSFKSSVHDGVPRELPTALIHLKYLTIHGVSFTHREGLSILVLLIKSSPNLEKLKIDNRQLDLDDFSSKDGLFTEDDLCSFSVKVFADIWLEHLNELHLRSFKNWGNEMNFVKLILAKSPVLKKVMIYLDHKEVAYYEELKISKVLLSSPRASPVAGGLKDMLEQCERRKALLCLSS